VLALKGPDHIAWLHLWPHARPWHLTRTQPMLRALPQVADVAALLQRAWSAQTGGAVEALATPASKPASEASQQGLQPSMG
jgi:hypothetical protein